jgi:DNA (cytosine-5)-methyltransferase 1
MEAGGVCTTLNAFDNGGESRATVLIVYAFDSLSSNSMKSKNPNSGSREITVAKTLDTTNGDPSKNQGGMAVLIIDGTRVDDVRVTDDEIMQTVIQRWGTGGGNVPAIAYESENVAPTLTAYNMDSRSPQSEEQQRIVNAVYTNTLQVRRLTPMECERLQGFPDGWTETQSDSQRYRQMGNAVTVNVIESIGQQLGRVSNG